MNGALMNQKEAANALGFSDRTFRRHRRELEEHIKAATPIGQKKYARVKVEAFVTEPRKLTRKPRRSA